MLHVNKPWRTCFAQALFMVAGWLSQIKTPQRTYRLITWDKDLNTDGWRTEKVDKRTWLPCRVSVNFLKMSMRLDNEHWDHWALDHGRHMDKVEPCTVCGGFIDMTEDAIVGDDTD